MMSKVLAALLFLSTASLATVLTSNAEQDATPTPPAQGGSGGELSRSDFLEDKVAPMVSPKSYDLTIVEYSDYQCPFCRKLNPELQKLLASDKKIRLIYRDWPIFGEQSVAAARVALASKYQGKHAQVHEALMAAPRPLTEKSIQAAAIKAGANWTRLQADLKKNSAEIDELLERNNAQAEALGLQGTPALIVGSYLVEGGLDYAGLKAAVEEARTKPKPSLEATPQPEGI